MESIRNKRKFAIYFYDRCIKNKLFCQISAESNYYANYVKIKSLYSLIITDTDRRRIKKRKRRIRDRLIKFQFVIKKAQFETKKTEVEIIEKQKKLRILKYKERKIFDRKIFNIKALKTDERLKTAIINAAGFSSIFDHSSFKFFSFFFFEDLELSGRIPKEIPGNF